MKCQLFLAILMWFCTCSEQPHCSLANMKSINSSQAFQICVFSKMGKTELENLFGKCVSGQYLNSSEIKERLHMKQLKHRKWQIIASCLLAIQLYCNITNVGSSKSYYFVSPDICKNQLTLKSILILFSLKEIIHKRKNEKLDTQPTSLKGSCTNETTNTCNLKR